MRFQEAHALIPAYDCILRTRRHPLLWPMWILPRWRRRTQRMRRRFEFFTAQLPALDRAWFTGAIFLALCLPAVAQTQCTVPAGMPATPVASTTSESNHVLKAGPGCLIAAYATAFANGFFMVFNATALPSNGAVSPAECVAVGANGTASINYAPQPPEWYSVGITVGFSSTGCNTLTAASSAYFHGIVQ